MPKITKRIVDASFPKDKPYFVWDIEIKGFGLLVLPSGVKSYVYQYRTPEGRSRRATIHKHGTKTAEEAREKAKVLQRAVGTGRDPLAEKKARRDALTIADLLDLYLESARFTEKADTTQALDRGRIHRHLKPTLGKRFVIELTSEDVRKAFAKIRDGKTAVDEKTRPRGRAIVRGGEGAARMSVRLLRAVLHWAASEGLCTTDPTAGVAIGGDGARDVILETADDYARLFRTLETMEQVKRLRPQVADVIRVIALTGARRGEITALRWAYVDLKTGVLKLPPGAHKTGAKTGKSRIIGLPAAAQAIIARQPQGKPEDYVFRPAKGKGALSLAKPWRAVRAEAGLPEGLVLHGLRHSIASHMAMAGAEAAEIMTALGHRQIATSQRYVHWAQDRRAEVAERAAAHITGALNADAELAEVAPIRRVK
ncbi:MAG: site-specific integrase [Gammaproteobacteria bacterium]|nr:site-specific integrase [Gammaproteobacteria bacterium]